MNVKSTEKITVQSTILAPIDAVWKSWTDPKEIVNWYFASEDWHCPRAENDLSVNGKFLFRMEAKDGSFGFDFEGIYTSVKTKELIEYVLADDRRISISFTDLGNEIEITETFDAETENPVEMQQKGWQAILNQFKKYTESN
ncbi:MAG: SRPBCC family protein [Prolixibacteraceae bacterium]